MADERGGVTFIMKKMLCIIPIMFLALLLVIGFGNQTCLADPVDGSGYSILLIDSVEDDPQTEESEENTTVNIDITPPTNRRRVKLSVVFFLIIFLFNLYNHF